MKNKIIKIAGCKTCKQVLISLERNNEDIDFIGISAWHETKDDGELYQYETIHCEDREVLKNIISDFSEFAANQFANSFSI